MFRCESALVGLLDLGMTVTMRDGEMWYSRCKLSNRNACGDSNGLQESEQKRSAHRKRSSSIRAGNGCLLFWEDGPSVTYSGIMTTLITDITSLSHLLLKAFRQERFA